MPGPDNPNALWSILGSRRPSPIGITSKTFRSTSVLVPSSAELVNLSTNPRNRSGGWYEAKVEEMLRVIKAELRLETFTRRKLDYLSPVYAGNRIVDVLVQSAAGKSLGLELKYLGGNGSLVKPKILVDAIDFTHRPVDCIYVIDGPGWLETKNVEYLAAWWSFSCAEHLPATLREYF
jgi:hypothetical protein